MASKTVTVHFILDESASMSSVQDATISGFNEYLKSLQKDDARYKLALTKFSINSNTTKAKLVEDVEPLNRDTYRADGPGTALFDAVCGTLHEVEHVKGKQLVVIMTDGMENSSREYTQHDLRRMREKLEAKGNWTFVFLGANQDSFDTARQYGFSAQNASNFNATSGGIKQAMHSMAVSTSAFAASGSSNTRNYFSSEQQTANQETK